MNPKTPLEMTTERPVAFHREMEVLNYALLDATILAMAENAAAAAEMAEMPDTKRATENIKLALDFAVLETRSAINMFARHAAAFCERKAGWTCFPTSEPCFSPSLRREHAAI